jgi:hypothetical protein
MFKPMISELTIFISFQTVSGMPIPSRFRCPCEERSARPRPIKAAGSFPKSKADSGWTQLWVKCDLCRRPI